MSWKGSGNNNNNTTLLAELADLNQAPCCNKMYVCRICHDNEQNHEIDRKAIKEVLCLKCGNEQEIKKSCKKCSVIFGNYFCAICNLFDDTDKKQFHCDECGICRRSKEFLWAWETYFRVGGKENFFHCEKCDMCYAIELQGNHRCIEKASQNRCPVCLEDIHTSRVYCHIPPCGHLLHVTCFRNLLKNGTYACPSCNESMIEMESTWKILDEEVENTPMPDEYKDFYVQILCRDCHKESKVKFHVVGLKCSHCPSYNTCRTAETEESESLPQTGGGEPNA